MSDNQLINLYLPKDTNKQEAKSSIQNQAIRLFFSAKCNNLSYQEALQVVENVFKGLHTNPTQK